MCLCFYVFKFIILSRSDKIYKLLYFTKADLCMNLWFSETRKVLEIQISLHKLFTVRKFTGQSLLK
jgi:hypothetical protein